MPLMHELIILIHPSFPAAELGSLQRVHDFACKFREDFVTRLRFFRRALLR